MPLKTAFFFFVSGLKKTRPFRFLLLKSVFGLVHRSPAQIRRSMEPYENYKK